MANPWDAAPIIEPAGGAEPWMSAPLYEPEAPVRQAARRVRQAAETAAPVVGDVARSVGSGLTRGAVGLADIPSLPGRGMDYLLERGATFFMGDNAPQWTQRPREFNQENPPPARALAQSVPQINAALSYSPQTTAGEYAQTVGEFVPGSLLGPGSMAGNAIRYGLLPGVASETAGQATEGTAAEPYARVAAGLLTPLATGRPTNNARPAIPRADPEDARMAETLMRNGVRPTAGQTTQSGVLRRFEGSLGDVPGQAEDLTAAALRTTGSTASRATPEALAQASDDIVRTMDDAVRGVSVTPGPEMAQSAQGVVDDYLRSTARNSVVPDVGNIADEIIDAATSPTARQISLDTLRDWRSRLGRMMQSGDAQTREAAYGLRQVIDQATEQALQAAGRTDDVAKLAAAREQYRNWLVVSDAATRAGAENGIVSPTQLHQAVIRTQGRRNVAIGNTTPLGELSRASAGVLRPESTVSPGGVRSLSEQVMGGGLGALAGSQLTPGNPLVGGLLGGIAGQGGISAGQAAMRSRAVQSLLMDPQSRIAQGLLAAPGAYATSQ